MPPELPVTRGQVSASIAVAGIILTIAAALFSWLGIPALVRKAMIEDPILKQSIDSVKKDAEEARTSKSEAEASAKSTASYRGEAGRLLQSMQEDAKSLAEEKAAFRPLKVEQGQCSAEVGGALSKTERADVNDFKQVNFSMGFSKSPVVLVALSAFEQDDSGRAGARLQLEAVDVTSNGFKCRFSAWGFSRFRIANATWLAIGH